MDVLDQLRAFVATAQTGSFTDAAHQLGISNRLTSKYVAALEARLGVRLLQRTTRRVGLTPAGEQMLARAPELLDAFDTLLDTAGEGRRHLSGLIRVSAPLTFGELCVSDMLARFAQAHPEVQIDLRLSDSFADLAAEGLDLAFRIGDPGMRSLRQRKLGETRALAVASPDWLAGHGTPAGPEALSALECIIDTNRRIPRSWVFCRGDETREVTVSGRLWVNSARAAVDLARAGQGIAFVPRFAVAAALAEGALLPVFDGWAGIAAPVNAVWLDGRVPSRKTRALVEFARADLRDAKLL